MDIIIQPKHLRGNSWSHMANPEKRRCPLFEALTEAYPNAKIHVGGRTISIDHKPYDMPYDKWNSTSVEDYIDAANTGSEESVTLTLLPIEVQVVQKQD